MITHRCKNCMWWDNQHPAARNIPIEITQENAGFCRKHKPGNLKIDNFFYGVQPVMGATEFCGEFRIDKE